MFKTIVIGIDGSKASFHAAVEAANLGLMKDAEVELVGALDLNQITLLGLSLLSDEERKTLVGAIESEYLVPIEQTLNNLGIKIRGKRVVEDIPHEALRKSVEELGADLLIIGRHGYGTVRRFMMGSVSSRMLEHALKPTLIVPDEAPFEPGTPIHIFVPVDFSDDAMAALEVAKNLAKTVAATITIGHCVPAGESLPLGLPEGAFSDQMDFMEAHQAFLARAEERLNELAAELHEQGVETTVAISSESVVDGICKARREAGANLIVLSSHGRSGFRKFWLGSVANGVVKQAACPVLVVPAQDSDDQDS